MVTVRRNVKQAGRCILCRAEHNARHNARRPDLHDPAEKRRRAQVVAAAGGWCQGWPGHPRHPSADLTAHHVDGPGGVRLVALCRSKNSAIGSPNRSQ
jgi:hypothetical protein